jgi:hypothetical protein
MTHTKDEAKAATPHHDLIAELLNPNTPKTEREHAASREIERLQALAAPTVQEPDRLREFKKDMLRRELAAQPAPLPIKPIVDPDLDVNQRLAFKLGWKSAEEAHGITKGQP